MTRPQTFVEHDILSLDAERGVLYQSFDEFWNQRMEPMQFIPKDADGIFAALRETMKERAREQYDLFWSKHPISPDHPLLTGPRVTAIGDIISW